MTWAWVMGTPILLVIKLGAACASEMSIPDGNVLLPASTIVTLVVLLCCALLCSSQESLTSTRLNSFITCAKHTLNKTK